MKHYPSRNFIYISFFLIFSGGLQGHAQDARWDGPELVETGWITNEPGFLTWIYCGSEGRNDWIYSGDLEQYLYMPAGDVRDAGSWANVPDLEALDLAALQDNWYWSPYSESWVYAPATTMANGSGWTYFANTGGPLPLVPEEIILEAGNVADHAAELVEQKYAQALKIRGDYVAQYADFDSGVYVFPASEGVTFYNASSTPGSLGNRQVRIGYNSGQGYLDFNALKDISGRIGVVIQADVDLSSTSNGFYARVLRDGTDVAAYERIGAGEEHNNVLLEPYLTNYEDDAYIELTLPWQSNITIKNIFLYMDHSVRGFDDMETRITGGQGATPENTHTVHNAAEYLAALEAAEAADAPSIIYVDGTISYDDWVVATGNEGREATLGSGFSDLSIIGVGTNGLMDGVGITVQCDNVIIQNLTVRYVLARDAIQINNGTYVKIDHCTLYNESFDVNDDKDKFDELISIKNNAQHVIVSWNEIFYTHKTILVGSNDGEDALPDRRVIFHHNWFHDGGSRHPLFRGGHAHIYNNFFQNLGNAVNARTNSKILIENNWFEDMNGAIGYWFDTSNPAGKYELHDNVYIDVGGDKPTVSTINMEFAGDYQYPLDPVENVPSIVTGGAGVGILSF